MNQMTVPGIAPPGALHRGEGGRPPVIGLQAPTSGSTRVANRSSDRSTAACGMRPL
jgi:hypothetical protein